MSAADLPRRAFGATIDDWGKGPVWPANWPQKAQAGWKGCDNPPKPGVLDFLAMVQRAYGVGGGIQRDCAATFSVWKSLHKRGLALDWMVNVNKPAHKQAATEVLTWLLESDGHGNAQARMRRFGIVEIIWDRHVLTSAKDNTKSPDWMTWRAYTGDNPHTDHIHFTFSEDGGAQRTSWWGRGSPAMISDAAGRMDGFSVDAGGAMRQVVWSGGPAWQPFAVQAGTWRASPAAARPPAVPDSGRIDLVGVGGDDRLWHTVWNGKKWGTPPENIDESLLVMPATGPCVVSGSVNDFDVFAVDPGGTMQRVVFRPGGKPWFREHPLPGQWLSTPSAVGFPGGRIDVVGIGSDRRVWHQFWDGQRWLGLERISDAFEVLHGTGAAIVSRSTDRFDVFAVDSDNRMRQVVFSGGDWQDIPGEIGAGRWSSSPGAASRAPDRFDLIARGKQGELFHQAWDGKTWSNPRLVAET
jgi:hypothetical protein